MEKSSKQYTAFSIPGSELYQCCRMSFGLTDAPATFQRLIDDLFGATDYPKFEQFVFDYRGDLIIVEKDFEMLWK